MKTRRVVFRKESAHVQSYPGIAPEMKHLFDGETVRKVCDLGELPNHGYFYVDRTGVDCTIDSEEKRGWWINPDWVDEQNFKDIEDLFEL